jgi:alkanesulfonate monooxygenase SsuD/methylene tetrahydromethanopterin reductase-like flavin-dependent oxidoreductase (luciferase family)
VAREAALRRTGRVFDGWIPTAPNAETWASGWEAIGRAAREAERAPDAVTPAAYLTLSLDRDVATAERRLAAFFESYYGLPFAVMRRVHGCFAGAPDDCADWLAGYARAGAAHLVLRSADLARDLAPLAAEVLPSLRVRTQEVAP